MNDLICRTCLKGNLTNLDTIYITDKIDVKEMVVKDMLEVFMPEMDLGISGSDTVLCLPCVELLKNAYSFKKICYKSEETIYDYLYSFNVQIGQTVNLKHVLDYESNNSRSTNNLINDCKIELKDLDSSDSSIRNDSKENVILLEELNKMFPNEQDKELFPKKRRNSDDNVDVLSKQRLYSCDLCEYKNSKYSSLQSHKRLCHIKQDENFHKVYGCDLCEYIGKTQNSLNHHMFVHQHRSKFQCEICKKFFQTKYKLRVHKRVHDFSSEAPHKCKECDERFVIRSQLRLHIEKNHLVELLKCPECCTNNCKHCEFVCDKCKSTFSRKREFQKHLSKHQ